MNVNTNRKFHFLKLKNGFWFSKYWQYGSKNDGNLFPCFNNKSESPY